MINPASLIGAIIGFFVGIFLFRSLFLGMLFAFLGSSIGSGFGVRASRENDQRGSAHGWFSGWGITGSADSSVFMDTLFSMLGRLAAADGHVSPEEERMFRSIVINELHITSSASVAAAMDVFRRGADGERSMASYASRASKVFEGRPQLLELMLIIMVRVSSSAGGIHPEEEKLLRETVNIFGFPPGTYASIRSRYSSTHSNTNSGGNQHRSSGSVSGSYSVLGVTANATESEIRRAYRRKAAEYHPDKIASKGLPKEFSDFANTKFQEIQNAWEQVRKARGF